MSSDPDKIHPLWLDLRAAAGTMSLWGQVAAAEMTPGDISKRILAACERLITAVELLEEATGWSGEDDGRAEVAVRAGEQLRDGPHCVVRVLLGEEGTSALCAGPATTEDLAFPRRRLRESLAPPSE